MVTSIRASGLLALVGILGTAPLRAAEPSVTRAGVVVIGSTPLIGSDMDREQVPEASEVLDAADIIRTGIPSLTGAILSNVASATVNGTEGNAFQPDILFRGFTASPVAGTHQGLAVYVNGARFNDAFGDTVNWDLIPPSAIQAVNLQAANPLFGLNALGGSVSVKLKNGFSTQTANFTAYGGSYGREAGIVEYGHGSGPIAVYLTADFTHDDGFRQTSTSNLKRLYTDLGWRNYAAEVHFNITAAHNTLGNPGATPIQALAANISNIFTAPNTVDNTFLGLNLNGSYRLGEATSLQGVAYFQTLNQVVPNGITEDVAPCDNGTGFLCNGNGMVVTGPNGQRVSDFLHGATYSGLSVQQLGSHAFGTSTQLTLAAPLVGHTNLLVAGLAFDGSGSAFAGVQEIGGFDPYTRQFVGPGIIQDQPSAGINPVRVRSDTRYYGLFATDVLALTSHLDLSLAGRFNEAQIALTDKLGGPVNGQHTYDHLNPSIGLTYRITGGSQIYGSYSASNRAPTPQELSCASAVAPCSLLNFFVGDPNLHQVVARTIEFGVRGREEGAAHRSISWKLDAYRAMNTSDIVFEAAAFNPNLAFYTNAGKTVRQGLEAGVRVDTHLLRISLGYAYTDATFRTPLLLNSGNNPATNPAGQEQVLPGDQIPGIPRHRINVVTEYTVTERWSVGASSVTQSGAYRFGDEANLSQPLGGYTVVGLDAAFHAGTRFSLFVVIDNVLRKRYETYGSFGPVGTVPWPGVPGGVSDPRTASPGAPITVYGGVRISL